MSNYTSPVVKEVKSKDWVEYGENNLYFEHLIDRYNGSPTNNACINGISQMIFGRGLDAINSSIDDYTEFKMLINDEDVQKISSDLKLLGNAAIQVVYNIDHTRILEVEHFPVETLRAGKANDEGVIEHYYYFPDWSKIKRTDKPTPICAFGTSTSGNEILYIKPYKAGFYYYAPPDYQGGLQYSELEEEISNYHLNNILNGLAPSMLINFNNGIPDEDMQATIEADVQRKYGGTSNAGRFILAFNDKPEEKATIEAIQLSDAHNQYQFLSDESMRKIMISHRVVSPLLLGIKDQTGFGNNADELKTASILMDNVVIRPFQDLIIKAIDKILAFNKINIPLYFKTLQPLEFTDLENATTKEQIVEETGQNFSKINDHMYTEIMAQIDGEVIDYNEWELVSESAAGEDEHLYNSMYTNSFKFAAQIQPTGGESWQDNDLFKIRYSYAGNPTPEREFCKLMMGNGLYYKYEDLDKDTTYNPGFGPRGTASYNIFLYKGGANCKHYWMRSIFLKKDNGKISVNQARQIINNMEPSERSKYRLPVNDPKVAKLPYDMPNHGYLNPR
ncbi:MAG: hypothetical protein ACOVK2_02510 [Candidatus Fonsibacter sp.]